MSVKRVIVWLSGIFLLVACLGLFYIKTPKKILEDNLTYVLTTAFSGPDARLEEYYQWFYNLDFENPEPSPADVNQIFKEIYGEYFTEKGMEVFITYYSFGERLEQLCVNTDWKTEATQVVVTPYHDEPHYYDYEVTVVYSRGGQEEGQVMVSGRVGTQADGKINFWNLSTESVYELRELGKRFQKDSSATRKSFE